MKRLVILSACALSLLLAACSPEQDNAAPIDASKTEPIAQTETAADEVLYCGDETTQQLAENYFTDMRLALEADGPPDRFDKFVGDRFTVIRDGRVLRFDKADFNSLMPHFFSIEDWRMLASQNVDDLQPLGYRGCDIRGGNVRVRGWSRRIASIHHQSRY